MGHRAIRVFMGKSQVEEVRFETFPDGYSWSGWGLVLQQ